MTITLDDVASLLHIPIDGMLLSHGSIPREEAVELMEEYFGSDTGDALIKVDKTKGAHCRFSYLERIFKDRLKEQRDLAAEYGVTEELQRLRDQAVRIYLLYLVEITIFSDKSQWVVDVVYLEYFRDLDLVAGYSWGAAWVFHHFPGMRSKYVWERYVENIDPRAMLFLPLSGLGIVDNYINYLDALDLTRVVIAPYGEHRQARQFERVSLYSGWLRCEERMVRYLPEMVLRQFGWVQTIPRHPVQNAPFDVNLAEITNRFQCT
ncbi:protein MAIN-LIKE 1-like [Medicago truncatula]|uniref:protein MAIN-LIKE 1-like n=1 Tax=Medicago truncatula TaxID=3880 RepID=UPI000D2F2498|nr:protein MAIN-LIKE 1-like [Medicago truncatula]